jgi:steroid delta-isomerase-like uncharacterized protein
VSEAENLAVLSRYYEEMFNKADMTVADEVFAPDYVSHHNDPVGLPPGPEGVKQFVAATREGFPDIHLTVEDMFAEGDKAASRWTLRGTNSGPFFGNPATGRPAEWEGVVITRFAGGRMAEEWYNFDQLRLLQQLGVIPTQ